MPPGFDVTVPEPLPPSGTTSGRLSAKSAVTLTGPLTVTVHVPMPVQSPLQPTKFELAFGDAVSVTIVPAGNVSVQSLPHAMPAGDDITRPPPLPPAVTVIAKL